MFFIISATSGEKESIFMLDKDFFKGEMGTENPSPEEVKNFLYGKQWKLGVFIKCTAFEIVTGSIYQLPIGFELQHV